MGWVLSATVFAYLVANGALLYSLSQVYGPLGIASLWGYAPNQFLFPAIFFPFAAFFSLYGLYVLVARIGPALAHGYPGRWFYHNWAVGVMFGVMLVAVIALTTYFNTAMSFDKLRPQYGRLALAAIAEVEDRVGAVEPSKRAWYRERMVADARAAKAKLKPPPPTDRTAMESWLAALDAPVRLQVVQDPGLQRRLLLMNRTVQALNVAQLLIALLTAYCAVYGIALAFHTSRTSSVPSGREPDLTHAIDSLFWAAVFFGAYPACYQQQRSQIEPYVGGGLTVLPQLFVAVVVTIALAVFIIAEPRPLSRSKLWLARLMPIAALAALSVISLPIGQPLARQLLGADTNAGIQVMVVLLTMGIGLPAAALVWPRPGMSAPEPALGKVELQAHAGTSGAMQEEPEPDS